MDLEILRKKISTFRTEKGLLTKVSDELAIEMLLAWEEWVGPARGFYRAIGVDFRKAARILGKAKKLKREGHIASDAFREIKVSGSSQQPCGAIEVTWEGGKIIRFSQVEHLVEFLKKSA